MGKVAFANPRIPVAELGPAAALLNDPDRAFFQNAELAASNWNVLNEQLDNLYLNNLSILSERNATKEDIDAAMHSIRRDKMLKNMMGPVSERYMAFQGRTLMEMPLNTARTHMRFTMPRLAPVGLQKEALVDVAERAFGARRRA